MDSQACQLWVQICSQLEAGGKYEAAAQERNQQAAAQSKKSNNFGDQSNVMLLVPSLLLRVRNLPPWPKPVWRELLKAEVPQRLGSLLSTLPASGSTISYLASEAYSRLVQRAEGDGILASEGINSKDASYRGLRQSLWQQVVRSGLLQHLPALLNQAEKLVQTQTASSGGSSQPDVASPASGRGRNTSTNRASSTKEEAQHGTAASSSTSSSSKACQLGTSDPIDVLTTLQGVLTHPATFSLRHSFCLITVVWILRCSAPGAGQAWPSAIDVAALQLAMACIRGWSAYIRGLPEDAGCEVIDLPLSNLTTILGYFSVFLELCQRQFSVLPLPLVLPCCVLETLVHTYGALLAAKQHLPGGILLKEALATPTATSTAPDSHGSRCSSSNNNNSPQASGSSCSRADCDANQQPSTLAGRSSKAAGNRSGRAANAGSNNTVGSSVQSGAAVRTSSEEELSPPQLWHIACTQQQAIPKDHMHLLELLGVDSRTILVMAAQVAHRGCVLEQEVCHRITFLGPQLSALLGRDHVLLQPPEIALLTSAPAALCYWIAHTNSQDQYYPAMCKLAAQLSHDMLVAAAAAARSRAHVYHQLRTPAPPGITPALLQLTAQISAATEALLAGAGYGSSSGATGRELQPDAGYPVMLDRVLRSVIKVLPRLDKKLLRYAGSPAGSSQDDIISKEETLLAVERVVQLAAYMGSSGCNQASAHDHSQEQPSNAEAAAVWQRLAVPLSNVLEHFIRSQAAPDRLADVTSRTCSAVSHAAACLSSVGCEGEMCCLARAMIHPECSNHQREQLLSLVFSLIKYCSNSRSTDTNTQDVSSSNLPAVGRDPVLLQVARDCCYAATITAMAILDTVWPHKSTSSGNPHSPDNQLATHCSSSSSTSSTSSVNNAAGDLGFACLAAFGRCCMEWAQQLKETPLNDVESVIKLPRYRPGSYSQQGARERMKQWLDKGSHVLSVLFLDACPFSLLSS